MTDCVYPKCKKDGVTCCGEIFAAGKDFVKPFNDATISPKVLKDLADLPVSALELGKDGRLEENWAGRGFNSWPYPTYDELPFPLQESLLSDMEPEVLGSVPLTYEETDEAGEPRKIQIGKAQVKTDGSFTAELNDGMKISGKAFSPMSFGLRVDGSDQHSISDLDIA